jgi:hypothetical protein
MQESEADLIAPGVVKSQNRDIQSASECCKQMPLQNLHKAATNTSFKIFFRVCNSRRGRHTIYLFIKRFMSITQNERHRFANRSPKRITITIPHSTFEAIIQRSNEEGRSLSNLAAFILEQGVQK